MSRVYDVPTTETYQTEEVLVLIYHCCCSNVVVSKKLEIISQSIIQTLTFLPGWIIAILFAVVGALHCFSYSSERFPMYSQKLS
jgi:hypothetical protein